MAHCTSNDFSFLETVYDFKNKKLDKNKINYVITHGSCPDGFMSATIIKMWLISQKIDINKIIFINAYYGTDYSQLPNEVKDKYVLICDFSFSEKITNEMIITTNNNLLILDHHKTAQSNLINISKEYVVFDMNHSGAFITYTYMFGFVNIPNGVLYVEDNDLWINKMTNTKEITSYISTLRYSFDEYEKLFNDTYINDIVVPLGKGMVILNNFYVKEIIKNSFVSFIELNGRYYFVALINSHILKNELGSTLLSHYNNVNLSAVYTHQMTKQQTIFSARSSNEKTDTVEISRIFNGGGHRNASGFAISKIINNIPNILGDDFTTYYDLENIDTLIINDKKYITINTQTKNVKEVLKYLLQTRTENNKTQEGLYCMRNKKNTYLDEYYYGSIAISNNNVLLLINNIYTAFENIGDVFLKLL
jgi:oligoribonuclease NrnB/cAMP/cGMP phosphodiesterase (DHH superfamily)